MAKATGALDWGLLLRLRTYLAEMKTTQCAVRWRLGDDLCDVLNLRAVRGRNVYVPCGGEEDGDLVRVWLEKAWQCESCRAKPCRFVLTVALRVRLRPRGAEYVFAEQFQWARTPGSTAASSIRDHDAHRATSSDTRRLRLGDIVGYFVVTSEPDRARGRAKPCRFVLTVALRVRLRPRGAEYVFAEQFQWARTPGSTAASLYVTTTLTELRHRTLDDFDSGTSLATSSSPLNRMSIF
ncbi:hypothetical protein HPB50_020748 [Hyalomma asiaticum]|uniref:Uncharacterized protein n=1 Tax=Hyalomma asiaticum TaxID=266040 RepID=A0ACB7RMC3_HYAAI|nr:hypothetical protein HPB50_020748 [Hyalomma asiaticum]